MKRILVIAGGEWQIPLIRSAKSMGHFVVNTNLYADSPGFAYADAHAVVDVFDITQNIAIARQYNVDAVVTDQTDIAVRSVAQVAAELQLPGIGVDIAQRFTSKFLMREYNAQCGFATPQYTTCTSVDEIAAFMAQCNGPVVIKPIANQSSRGVIKLESNDPVSIRDAYAYANPHTPDGRVIVEEYIGGTEITVDGIKLNDGNHYCLATSYKDHYTHNPMIAYALWFSQTHPTIDYATLHAQHNELVLRMGLPFGVTHAEYKYYNGKFYLIEVAARGGGTNISSHIVPAMSGIDSVQYLLRMATGEQIQMIHPQYHSQHVVLYFYNFDSGVVSNIAGVEAVNALPGVIKFGLNIKPGQRILPPGDDRSRHAFAIVSGASHDQVVARIDQIRATIQVTYE